MPMAFSQLFMYGAAWVSVGETDRMNSRRLSCLPFLTRMPPGPVFQPSAVRICLALLGS